MGISWETEQWFLAASYSIRHTELDDSDADFDDHSVELSLGRIFASGAYIDFGYQSMWEDGDEEHFISLNFGFLGHTLRTF